MTLWLMMLACTRGDGAGELALPGGAAVVLLADGDLELRVDGRRTLALAGGVEVRSFTEEVEGNLGQWRFTRGDVDVTSRRFTEVRRRGGTIEVGLAGGGQLSVTDDGPGRTRIRVEASGGGFHVRVGPKKPGRALAALVRDEVHLRSRDHTRFPDARVS